MHAPSAVLLGVAALAGFVAADSHADTRYGTKQWVGQFYDPDNCPRSKNYQACLSTEDDQNKLIYDQFDAAFEKLCQDVSCEGSFDIYFPGDDCDSKSLGPNVAFSITMDAEYTNGDRAAVKDAYTNTIQKLNKRSHDCGKFDISNALLLDFPTDINIVRDTDNQGIRSFLHITLATEGESACDTINAIWGAVGGSIPGGAIFGAILKGTCK